MEENVKTKTITRLKERRQPHNQEGVPKRTTKHQGLIKNDLPQLSPPQKPSTPFEGSSPIKKLFSEANKIVKIGMEKEYALLERETTLQNSNETIDNLRKNMLHLQMEYEKLDQNFQKEISCRTEIVKRMDATRELVESVVQCSNVLAASIKQLEDDKLKIAEFYELICQNQKEVEGKHAGAEKLLKDQEELLNAKLGEIKAFQKKIISQNTETITQLNRKLVSSDAQLKTAAHENENLQKKFQECQDSSNRLQSCLEHQEKLNGLLQETVGQFKRNIKILKVQRFKYQKLLKIKKKQLSAAVNRKKDLKKSLDKVHVLYGECLSTNKILKSKDDEWRTEFEKHLNEDLAEREAWEAQRKDLMNQITCKEAEVGDLRAENRNLNEKMSNVASIEGAKQLEIEQIQNELSKMLKVNLNLQENVAKLSEENNEKEKTISELEKRSIAESAPLEFYRNEARRLEEATKNLESELTALQERLSRERTEHENRISDLKVMLEENIKTSSEKISNLEKLLEDKAAYIEKLETEKNQFALSEKMALENLEKELEMEKLKNRELSKNVEREKESREDMGKRLEETKNQISDYTEKIEELKSLNNTLQRAKIEMDKDFVDLKKELELGKKSFCSLEGEHMKAERELDKLRKVAEENVALKSSVAELKKLLEATEARLEAYKVAVKKLESEKVQTKNHHSEEVSRLKTELNRLEDALKKENRPPGTPQMSFENLPGNRRERETSNTRARNISMASPQIPNTKEVDQEAVGFPEEWHQTSTPPAQNAKKYTSTPRKILTSTNNFRSLTPLQKKRDPYEFDSDGSAEQIDHDKVVKVLNRQKKETNKRLKVNK